MPTGTPRFPSIPAALSHWAAHQPDAPAYSFLGAGLDNSRRLSYRELELSARRIGTALQQIVRRGDRVLLLFPPGQQYLVSFLGCLYAGAIAVPLYPPRLGAKFDRIQAVLQDCTPRHALTTQALADLTRSAGVSGLNVHVVEALATEPAGYPPEPPGTDLAFLQYTSGSTGRPKGVMVSHHNLVCNEEAIAAGFGVRPDDTIFSWLPMYHDMGLIGTALLPLYLGLHSVLLDTFAFIQDPLLWPLGIDRYGATCSGGPNFAYQLLVDRYDQQRLAEVDLSQWRIAFNGAEPINEATLQALQSRFAPHGFAARAIYPCYGLAEATLFVTGAEPMTGYRSGRFGRDALATGRLEPPVAADADTVDMVSAGRPALHTTVVVCDPQQRPLPDGHIGEVYVQSPSVAGGYWGNEAETERTFRVPVDGRHGHFLCTGDLGAMWQGELYLAGRKKDVLIVAGRNFYPHDIEAVATRCAPQLRPGCAVAVQPHPALPQVVLVAEVRRAGLAADPQALATLRAEVARAVAVECDVQLADVVLIQPGSLPKTSSGKLRRADTGARYRAGTLRVVGDASPQRQAPVAGTAQVTATDNRRTALRGALGALLAAQLGRPITEQDAELPLAALGLGSIKLAALRGSFEQVAGRIDGRWFYGDRSLNEVVDAALGCLPASRQPAELPDPDATSGPAASGQIQMQFYDEMFGADTANNLPVAVLLSRQYLPELLRSAIAAEIRRQPALRTVLGPAGSGTLSVRQDLVLDCEEREFSDIDDPALHDFLTEVAFRRFRLDEGPLVRAAIALSPHSTVLLLVCHHAIVDHWSLRRLLIDILAALPGIELPGAGPKPTAAPSVSSWARAQTAYITSEMGQRRLAELAERWWPLRNQLLFPAGGSLSTRRHPAGVLDFEFDPAESLYSAAAARGHTVFVSLATGYLHALHTVTGEKQIPIGVPHHGRHDSRFIDTFGCLVNMLPLLGDFRDDDRLEDLEARTQQELLTSLEHAEVPFAELVRAMKPDRVGQNPLFQATLTFQESADDALAEGFSLASTGCRQVLGEVEVGVLDLPPRDVAFAISLYGVRHAGRLAFRLVHQRELIDRTTAQRIADEFVASLGRLAERVIR